jgi:hypothetical protein
MLRRKDKGVGAGMARLVIAAGLVLVALAVVAAILAGISSARRTAVGAPDTLTGGSSLEKIAFFLLLALILYVSASGGA